MGVDIPPYQRSLHPPTSTTTTMPRWTRTRITWLSSSCGRNTLCGRDDGSIVSGDAVRYVLRGHSPTGRMCRNRHSRTGHLKGISVKSHQSGTYCPFPWPPSDIGTVVFVASMASVADVGVVVVVFVIGVRIGVSNPVIVMPSRDDDDGLRGMVRIRGRRQRRARAHRPFLPLLTPDVTFRDMRVIHIGLT